MVDAAGNSEHQQGDPGFRCSISLPRLLGACKRTGVAREALSDHPQSVAAPANSCHRCHICGLHVQLEHEDLLGALRVVLRGNSPHSYDSCLLLAANQPDRHRRSSTQECTQYCCSNTQSLVALPVLTAKQEWRSAEHYDTCHGHQTTSSTTVPAADDCRVAPRFAHSQTAVFSRSHCIHCVNTYKPILVGLFICQQLLSCTASYKFGP